jgi:formylglycine-generating enzyme required for sulfatase activity
MKNVKRSGVALALTLLLCACGPATMSTPVQEAITPVLGETWNRPMDKMEMVFVPAGAFSMGSDREMVTYAQQLCKKSGGEMAIATCKFGAFVDEQPAHKVSLEAFWLDRTEITNRQYRMCVEAEACVPPRLNSSFSRERYYDNPVYEDYPAINVDFSMAASYCAWAGARLPTEAEWEYGARGPESLIFPWGNTFESAKLNYCDVNCKGLSDSTFEDGYPDTAPVGRFPAGASWVGALDMAGNVREWVAGTYAYFQSGKVVNQSGLDTEGLKIPRGGSWYDKPDDVRSANRGGELADYFRHNLGFRCARDEKNFNH